MTEADAYAVLTEILRDVLMQDDLHVTQALTAQDVEGWDSFKQVEIILAIESRCGFTFRSRELDTLSCAGDLATIMMARGNATAA